MARDRNITTLSNLEIVPDTDDPLSPDNGLYPPRLTQAQIDDIDVVSNSKGCLAYNTVTGSLQTVNESNDWVDIAVSGGTTEFVDLEVTNTIKVGPIGSPTVTLDQSNGLISGTNVVADHGSFADGLSVAGTAPIILTGPVSTGTDVNVTGDVITSNSGTFGSSTLGSFVAPIAVALGTAAAGSTNEMSGSLVSGYFRITTPVSPSFSGTILATFTLPVNPVYTSLYMGVIFTPFNSATALAVASKGIYAHMVNNQSGPTQATFRLEITSGQTLAANTIYEWNYTIIGNKQL